MVELPPPFDDQSFREHARFVRALAGALARDRDEADEVAARTFASAVEQRPRAGAQLRGWLARVARRALSRLRRDDARRDAHESAAARSERVDADPADLAARTELTDRIALAFAQLDEPAKTTLFLRFFADLSPKQIAARQQLPVETVKTRLKRGLARLRARLDERQRGTWRTTALALARDGAPLLGLTKAKGAAAAAAVFVVASAVTWWRVERRESPIDETSVASVAAASAASLLVDEHAPPAVDPDAASAPLETDATRRSEEPPLPFATGVVVDEHGTPIQGARVVASFEDLIVDAQVASKMKLQLGASFVNNASALDFALIDRHTLARSDRDGRFAVSIAPDHLAGLHLVAPDRAPASRFEVSSLAAENQDWRVTLERGCVARGRIHDREGRPVLGAWVGASDYDPKPVASVPSPHPVAPTCTGPRPGVLAVQSCVDAEARFELQLPRRSCRIWAVAPGYVDALVDFEPEAGECDITLWRTRALLDVVDARTHAPVPAVHALVLRIDRPEYGSFILPTQLLGSIAPNSRNTIPTPPARLIVPSSAELFLFADGYRSKTYELAFGPGDEPPHETIALEPGVEPVTIAGIVRGARNARVELRWIPMRPEPGETGQRIAQFAQQLNPDYVDRHEPPLTTTDVDREGRFAFRGLPAGTWCIDVAAAGRAPRRRIVTAPVTDFAVDLVASAQLEVLVVDAAGAPCAGATVHVQAERDARAWSQSTGRDGVATFPNLPDAEFHLVAARELHDLRGDGVVLLERSAFSSRDDVTLAAGERRRVQLALVEPIPVTLHVHDVNGRSIEGANILVSLIQAHAPDELLRTTVRGLASHVFETDVDGEAQLELWPSAWTFEVWAEGHHFHVLRALNSTGARRIELELADE
jgi:RNA polymerase sigma-70 factor (ECF subfamily)